MCLECNSAFLSVCLRRGSASGWRLGWNKGEASYDGSYDCYDGGSPVVTKGVYVIANPANRPPGLVCSEHGPSMSARGHIYVMTTLDC